MVNMEARLPQPPDELQWTRLDLMKRLLATIQEWGKAHSQKGVKQMGDVTVDALLSTIVTICLYRELSSSGGYPQNVQKFLERVNKDGPIEDDDDELVVAVRARKDLLLRNLKREVRAF